MLRNKKESNRKTTRTQKVIGWPCFDRLINFKYFYRDFYNVFRKKGLKIKLLNPEYSNLNFLVIKNASIDLISQSSKIHK